MDDAHREEVGRSHDRRWSWLERHQSGDGAFAAAESVLDVLDEGWSRFDPEARQVLTVGGFALTNVTVRVAADECDATMAEVCEMCECGVHTGAIVDGDGGEAAFRLQRPVVERNDADR